MELERLYKNSLDVQSNLSLSVAIAGEKNKDELADINVEQMNKGIGGDGKKITPKYSSSYAKIKGFKTPNLKVIGDYHESIAVERKKDRWLFFSEDAGSDKVDFLESHYDDNQYGIAPQNEQKAANEIEPDLFKDIEKQLEKGIL